jgi:hypothetical protein
MLWYQSDQRWRIAKVIRIWIVERFAVFGVGSALGGFSFEKNVKNYLPRLGYAAAPVPNIDYRQAWKCKNHQDRSL